MSVNIPRKLATQTYKKWMNKLVSLGVQIKEPSRVKEYKALFSANYKKARGEQDYHLQHGLNQETKRKLDYLFRCLEKKEVFNSIEDIAHYLRLYLEDSKFIVLFAYNGTGKTRLSGAFKKIGQVLNESTGEKSADTLYYNAFTEDLFTWDNDLPHDTTRSLKMNTASRFIAGLNAMAIEEKVTPFLHRYADFNFTVQHGEIKFHRDVMIDGNLKRVDNIKISRGEERIFIWSCFLAIIQMAIDQDAGYDWVKYIYIDDPISSLDDNNVIAVATDLAELLKQSSKKVVVSTHHPLFFNILCNTIKKSVQLFLHKTPQTERYLLKGTAKTPFFHHVALLKEMKDIADSGTPYTYHFNILRNILEKTASFLGYENFSSCVKKIFPEDEAVYSRVINLLSHGNYSIFEPQEMVEDNKKYFREIVEGLLTQYPFNPKLFEPEASQGDAQ